MGEVVVTLSRGPASDVVGDDNVEVCDGTVVVVVVVLVVVVVVVVVVDDVVVDFMVDGDVGVVSDGQMGFGGGPGGVSPSLICWHCTVMAVLSVAFNVFENIGHVFFSNKSK